MGKAGKREKTEGRAARQEAAAWHCPGLSGNHEQGKKDSLRQTALRAK